MSTEAPITDDPLEWEVVGEGMLRHRKRIEFYSIDGGKSYYSIVDPKREMRISKKKED